MHLISWAILIGLLILLGAVLQRTWLNRQNDAEDSAERADEPETQAEQTGRAAQWSDFLRTRVQTFRSTLTANSTTDIVTQFRQWAETLATSKEPALSEWLGALSDTQITALVEHLSEFCHDMGFELSWLLDGSAAQNAEFTKQLETIVLLYARASYQAVLIQEDVELYRIYMNLIENPKHRSNRELSEHIFGQLVEAGITDVTISEHLSSSTRKRQQQILKTLQKTAQESPKLLNSLLKAALIERAESEVVVDAVVDAPVGSAASATPAVPATKLNPSIYADEPIHGMNGTVKTAA